MADRTIKPDSGNDLVLQNNGGGTKIEIPNSGDIEITGTIGSGTFNGSIGSSASFPAGTVIQTVQYVEDGTASISSVNTNSFASFSTAFKKGITPIKSNSKILITIYVSIGNDLGTIHLGIFRDGSELSGASHGSPQSGQIGSTAAYRYNGTPYSLAVNPITIVYLDSPTIPATPIEIEYELKATAGASYNENFFLNNSALDSNNDFAPRVISTITLQEIAG